MSIDPRIGKAFREANGFELEPHLLVLGLMGSHSHGTYIPPAEPDAADDVDLMGFLVPPLEYHLGLPRWRHWTFQFEELDVVIYSLEKAVRLLLKSNPNMGEKRKAMVRKYQYDVKNAAHLIRLLRMGTEFLRTGRLQVFRTADAEELKAIKQGGWMLEQVKAEADRLFADMEEARAQSPLPPKPDETAADALLVEIHRAILNV
jgi:predicted nucleotidyltransferase